MKSIKVEGCFIIITLTRKFAVHVEKHITALQNIQAYKTILLIGGVVPQKQERLLVSNKGPDIVIGTPDHLWEHIIETMVTNIYQILLISST